MAVTVKQARRLSAAAGVDVIAALSALERNNGDALSAMQELERQGMTPPPPGGGFYSTRPSGAPAGAGTGTAEGAGAARRPAGPAAWSDVKDGLGELFHKSLVNRMEVWRKGRQAASVPLLVLAVLLLFFFWEIAAVLAVGLALGFRYRLSGPFLEGKEVRGLTAALRRTLDRLGDRLRRR